jgi:cytochrome c oxidase assembly protein subunit 15
MAESRDPRGPVTLAKAWKEMTHRYLAGTLGVLVLALAVTGWKQRHELRQSPWPPTLLVGLVVLQATLGMWTVTRLLKPAIVTGHLLGGMAIWGLLVWINMGRRSKRDVRELARARRLRWWALLALVVAVLQIVLGGWVSSNYAALACPDLPTCQGVLVPAMDFSRAFQIRRELGMSADGVLLSNANLVAIHWVHRLGALMTLALAGGLALRLMSSRDWRPYGWILAASLALQLSLGVATVALRLPLGTAVAHNGGAALLLAVLLMLNYELWHAD